MGDGAGVGDWLSVCESVWEVWWMYLSVDVGGRNVDCMCVYMRGCG